LPPSLSPLIAYSTKLWEHFFPIWSI